MTLLLAGLARLLLITLLVVVILVVAGLFAQRQGVYLLGRGHLLVALPGEDSGHLQELLARHLAHVLEPLLEGCVVLALSLAALLLLEGVHEVLIPAQLIHELLVLQHQGELFVRQFEVLLPGSGRYAQKARRQWTQDGRIPTPAAFGGRVVLAASLAVGRSQRALLGRSARVLMVRRCTGRR